MLIIIVFLVGRLDSASMSELHTFHLQFKGLH